jgi:hypothetical protein
VENQSGKNARVCVAVNPGVCGFTCFIKAQKGEKQTASIEICGSECKQIQRLSEILKEVTLQALFTPVTRNPILVSAQRAGCHVTCLVPLAVAKAVEVVMDVALSRDVSMRFEPCE